jgi:hypothetical protein
MKTPEKLFTELASGELECPCEFHCKCRKAVVNQGPSLQRDPWKKTQIIARHETFDDFLECIANRLSRLINEIIVERRSTRNLSLPVKCEFLWLTSDNVVSSLPWSYVYKEAIKKYNLQFSESYGEFEHLVNTNFLPLCEFIISKIQKIH